MLQLQTFYAKATKTNKIKLLFDQFNLLYKLPRIASYNRSEEPNLEGETKVHSWLSIDRTTRLTFLQYALPSGMYNSNTIPKIILDFEGRTCGIFSITVVSVHFVIFLNL